MRGTITLHGDCLELLRTLPGNSVDAVVTEHRNCTGQNRPCGGKMQKPVIGFGPRLNRHIHRINNSHASSVGGFRYSLDFIQPDGECKHLDLSNLIPDAGLRYLGGGTAFEGMATYSEFFFVLYTNGRAPLVTDTMVNLPEYGELVTGTDRTSRQRWNFTRTGGTYDSSGNPALYTVTAASVEVRGIMLCTQAAYLSTDGILLSARLLDSPETVRQGGFIRATATHTFQRGAE